MRCLHLYDEARVKKRSKEARERECAVHTYKYVELYTSPKETAVYKRHAQHTPFPTLSWPQLQQVSEYRAA